ncbi:MAG: four helix bundle protein [Acidobacteria bacterium]|nr:four helix bundle protein [Acidobacteriota bacterium]
MPSIADELAARVRSFSIRVVKFARAIPRESLTEPILRQLVKSATSESANYQAARRGRSRKEFIAKLGTVVEEADETEHWLFVLDATRLPLGQDLVNELARLQDEARQLRAIFVASLKTARYNDRNRKKPRG